ncbi:MAG: UDP-N-acetylmuramoyl-tripeptide--D-alanyl-D-alanine ligase [Flavihumibacter sp.]
MTIPQLYEIFKRFRSIQTDTRKLKPGDLYFALKGEHFNGNAFAADALKAGASYAIIDNPSFAQDERTIIADDVLCTLQALALHHRRQFNIPVIAITGSNGKTTTKELVHAVLSTTYKTYTTEGNLNNHIGIPLTLLKIGDDAQMAVVEMGANHQHEITAYCQHTEPTHGLITNLGKAHLEGFGGVEGVRKGKGELFAYLRSVKGRGFLLYDDPWLKAMGGGLAEVIAYGTAGRSAVQELAVCGEVRKSEPFLEAGIVKGLETTSIGSQLVGAYNLPNIHAAIAVGKYFGVPEGKIVEAIAQYKPENNRSQLLELHSNHIILDAYNANPSSMRAAIENFAILPADSKVLILGAMAELGPESLQEHKEIVALIDAHPWTKVVLVGGDFGNIEHKYIQLANSEAARDWFNAQHFSDTHILIKGSRSMKMEKVLRD